MLRPDRRHAHPWLALPGSRRTKRTEEDAGVLEGGPLAGRRQDDPLEAYKKVVLVIQDARLSFKDSDKIYEEVEFKIDADAKPKEIDYKYVFGLKKGVQERGIYQWDGEQLTICMAQSKQKRPDDFLSKKGAGVQLLKLKRVNP